jgi:hypothetical protein
MPASTAPPAPALDCPPGTSVINQDAAHGFRGSVVERRGSGPLNTRLREACIRLVNERRRLKGVPGPFSIHLDAGDGAQLRVDTI